MSLLKELPVSDRAGWPWSEEVAASVYSDKPVWPKISIVTPSYNQGQFIEETMRSVLLQNYPNIEYIIIDGGSTDNTIEIIKKYEKWITYWVSERDNGQSDAINKGFEKCTGQIMNWLNSDDFLLKDALFHIGKHEWEKNTGALVGKGYIVNLKKDIIYTPPSLGMGYESFLHWMRGYNFMQPACYFSKAAWDKCGPLDGGLNFCMDLDLWLKMAKQFGFERLDEDIAFAYGHENAKTTAWDIDCKVEIALLISQYGHRGLAMEEMRRVIEMAVRKNMSWTNCIKALLGKASRRLGIK